MIRGPALGGALLACGLALASCGRDGDGPVAPPAPAAGDSTTSMLFLEGRPRCLVLFDGGVTEATSGGALSGSFRVLFDDSAGRRVFLPDVRLNGEPMVEQVDPFGSPVQSTLDLPPALPGLALADTLRLVVADGGEVTPPFTLGVVPSRFLLPADSTVVPRDRDLVLPFSGRVERIILTLTDGNGKRLRFQLLVDHYSGLARIVVPARDLRGLAPGLLLVGTNVADTETAFAATGQPVLVTYQSTQRRAWKLAP